MKFEYKKGSIPNWHELCRTFPKVLFDNKEEKFITRNYDGGQRVINYDKKLNRHLLPKIWKRFIDGFLTKEYINSVKEYYNYHEDDAFLEIAFQHQPKDSYLESHIDVSSKKGTHLMYFTDDLEGGELIVSEAKDEYKSKVVRTHLETIKFPESELIKKTVLDVKGNTSILFKNSPDFLHGVGKVLEGDRYSLNVRLVSSTLRKEKIEYRKEQEKLNEK